MINLEGPQDQKNPYRGHSKKDIFNYYLSGSVSGLGQRPLNAEDTDGGGDALWRAAQEIFYRNGVDKEIIGETVIELGCGSSDKSARFRDWCANHGAKRYEGVDLFSTPSDPPEEVKGMHVGYANGEDGDATAPTHQPE